MSIEERYQEYLTRYARDYCNGNVEEAAKHAIVKSYIEYLEKEDNEARG